MDRIFGPHQPGPFGTTLAALIGGEMVYEPAIDDYVIHADRHILTWSKGAVILDAHSPAAVELGRHSEGASKLAAAFRMATTGVAA